jgi:hypothetical protein
VDGTGLWGKVNYGCIDGEVGKGFERVREDKRLRMGIGWTVMSSWVGGEGMGFEGREVDELLVLYYIALYCIVLCPVAGVDGLLVLYCILSSRESEGTKFFKGTK